jgi:hypothetical protein
MRMPKPDDNLLASLSACVVHARDLVEAAKAVEAGGRSNIAYHLATLALEELGKRELYRIQAQREPLGRHLVGSLALLKTTKRNSFGVSTGLEEYLTSSTRTSFLRCKTPPLIFTRIEVNIPRQSRGL